MNTEIRHVAAPAPSALDPHLAALLAATDGLRLDASLVAANRRTSDLAWYDAFALAGGRIVVSVGDVAGGGNAVPALVQVVRDAVAASGPTVASAVLVQAVDAAFREQIASALTTAIVGIIDISEQTFTYTTAGHPPPFVRYRDGTVRALPADGLPIGLAEADHPAAHVVVDLRDVSFLALYSSGLIQTTRDLGDGLQRLEGVITDERMAHCSSPTAWLERRLLGEHTHGNVAMLTLALPTRRSSFETVCKPLGERPNWSVSWSFAATGSSSNGARRAFMAYLQSKANGGRVLDYAAAELVFGELLGNVVRHAPGWVDITLDWTADLPVLHVLDNGPGFRSRRARERLPIDDWSESGRGLFIINACAATFSVRNRNGRGTHACATLPLA